MKSKKGGRSRLGRLFTGVSSVALFVTMGAGLAQAQTAMQQVAQANGADVPTQAEPAEPPLEELIITGFRKSLGEALDTKRDAVGHVDAIMAEDMADFPDMNLAESIQRVPGVAIDRDAGEGRQITLRGLGPTFTRVTLNGMETLGTTGGTDSSGGTNRSRAFDFNIFASELFNSITVRKTSSAEVEEGGIAGVVELRTARPFDYDGFKMAVTGQLGYNDLAEKVDPRGAFLISDTFLDQTVGALLSVAYAERTVREEGHSTVRWEAGGFQDAGTAGLPLDELNEAFHPRIPRYGVVASEQERLGITGALQFAPTNSIEINLDLLYANFGGTRTEHYIEAVSFSRRNASGIFETLPRNVVVQDGTIVAGEFDNVDIWSEARVDELETDFYQAVLSGDYDVTDSFTIRALGGYEKSDFSNPVQDTLLMISPNQSFGYDYRGNDRLPLLDFGFDTTNPENFIFDELRSRPNTVLNELYTAKLEGEYHINDDYVFQLGGVWKKFTFEQREYRADTTQFRGRSVADLVELLPFDDFGQGLDLPSGQITRWLVPNLDTGFDILGLGNLPVALREDATQDVTEEQLGGFAQLDFTFDLAGRPLRGNVGVRVVETKQESTGFNNGALVTIERDYTNTLPSLNLAWEVTDDVVLRGAASRNITRPALGNLTPGGSVDSFTRRVTAGNPFLEPFKADSFDASAEWYFSDEGLLAAAFFYKDVKSFVATESVFMPYNQSGFPLDLVDTNIVDPSEEFEFRQPINGQGADVVGLELIYQQPFDFLPAPWDGFGVVANYTYVDSTAQYGPVDNPIESQLVGLSKHSANGTLYYENETFGARISVNYRDDYLSQVPGRNGNDVEGKNSSINVDFSAFYNVSDNLEISLEAINLTDEFNDQFVDSSDRVYVYTHTGRQVFLGFRYSY